MPRPSHAPNAQISRDAVSPSLPIPCSGREATLDDLRVLQGSLRRNLAELRRAGSVAPSDLRARLAACEADLMEAHFDNMPV